MLGYSWRENNINVAYYPLQAGHIYNQIRQIEKNYPLNK